MNAPLIGTPTCANCAHNAIQNGQLVCAHNPPQSFPIVALVSVEKKDASGKDIIVFEPQVRGFGAAFPAVQPDMRCGQHKAGLVRAGAGDVAAIAAVPFRKS